MITASIIFVVFLALGIVLAILKGILKLAWKLILAPLLGIVIFISIIAMIFT